MSWQGLNDFIARVHDRLDPPVGDARLVEGGDMDFLTPDEVAIIRPAAVLFGVIRVEEGLCHFDGTLIGDVACFEAEFGYGRHGISLFRG